MTAQKGGVAFGVQAAMGTAATVFTSFALVEHNINPIPRQDTLPAEVGGVLLPRGAYKLGYVVAGTMTMVARLEDLGILLYGALGSESTGAVEDTTVYPHTIEYAADQSSLPWLTVRRNIQGEADTDQYVGCKIVSLRITIPGSGLVVCEVGLMGREAQVLAATSIPAPTTEQFALGCKGSITLTPADGSGAVTSFLSATLEFANQVTSPEETQDIGSYVMGDIIVKSRQAGFTLAHRASARTLYESICGVGATPAAWDAEVPMATLSLQVESAEDVPGSSTPYSLAFDTDTDNAVLAMEPIRGQGNSLIFYGVRGSILHTANPFTFTLKNADNETYATS